MIPRWFYVAALTIGILALCLVPPTNPRHHIAFFERLATRIERAPDLSPDAHEAIARLVNAARQHVPHGINDAPHAARRQAAIERVTNAIQAKRGGLETAGVGNTGSGSVRQRPPD
jgi:hypothetical protein